MQNRHIEILPYISLHINNACVKGDIKDRDSEVCISCPETQSSRVPILTLVIK
jgi:hypothetical protein